MEYRLVILFLSMNLLGGMLQMLIAGIVLSMKGVEPINLGLLTRDGILFFFGTALMCAAAYEIFHHRETLFRGWWQVVHLAAAVVIFFASIIYATAFASTIPAPVGASGTSSVGATVEHVISSKTVNEPNVGHDSKEKLVNQQMPTVHLVGKWTTVQLAFAIMALFYAFAITYRVGGFLEERRVGEIYLQ